MWRRIGRHQWRSSSLVCGADKRGAVVVPARRPQPLSCRVRCVLRHTAKRGKQGSPLAAAAEEKQGAARALWCCCVKSWLQPGAATRFSILHLTETSFWVPVLLIHFLTKFLQAQLMLSLESMTVWSFTHYPSNLFFLPFPVCPSIIGYHSVDREMKK